MLCELTGAWVVTAAPLLHADNAWCIEVCLLMGLLTHPTLPLIRCSNWKYQVHSLMPRS